MPRTASSRESTSSGQISRCPVIASTSGSVPKFLRGSALPRWLFAPSPRDGSAALPTPFSEDFRDGLDVGSDSLDNPASPFVTGPSPVPTGEGGEGGSFP